MIRGSFRSCQTVRSGSADIWRTETRTPTAIHGECHSINRFGNFSRLAKRFETLLSCAVWRLPAQASEKSKKSRAFSWISAQRVLRIETLKHRESVQDRQSVQCSESVYHRRKHSEPREPPSQRAFSQTTAMLLRHLTTFPVQRHRAKSAEKTSCLAENYLPNKPPLPDCVPVNNMLRFRNCGSLHNGALGQRVESESWRLRLLLKVF